MTWYMNETGSSAKFVVFVLFTSNYQAKIGRFSMLLKLDAVRNTPVLVASQFFLVSLRFWLLSLTSKLPKFCHQSRGHRQSACPEAGVLK